MFHRSVHAKLVNPFRDRLSNKQIKRYSGDGEMELVMRAFVLTIGCY